MTAGLSAIPYYIYSYILYRKNSDKNDVTGREDTYIVQENEQHAKKAEKYRRKGFQRGKKGQLTYIINLISQIEKY